MESTLSHWHSHLGKSAIICPKNVFRNSTYRDLLETISLKNRWMYLSLCQLLCVYSIHDVALHQLACISSFRPYTGTPPCPLSFYCWLVMDMSTHWQLLPDQLCPSRSTHILQYCIPPAHTNQYAKSYYTVHADCVSCSSYLAFKNHILLLLMQYLFYMYM